MTSDGEPRVGGPNVCICLPTFNEAENLEPLVNKVRRVVAAHAMRASIIIIDDDSPDGTGDIADALAGGDPRLHVLHRSERQGLGPAYCEGFRHALAADADLIVEMDCDFSHDPADIPRLVDAARDADLVLGSRYVAGGGTQDWGLARRVISRGGCLYARTVLGVGTHDLTGGFKCFRREVVEALPLDDIQAAGYVFQVETTYRAILLGYRVKEIPITFRERTAGSSKMSRRIVTEAAIHIPRLRHHLAPSRRHARR